MDMDTLDLYQNHDKHNKMQNKCIFAVMNKTHQLLY